MEEHVGNALAYYFPVFAGVWLAIALIVVLVDTYRRVQNEKDKKPPK